MNTKKPTEPKDVSGLDRSDIERLIEVIHDKGIQEFELEQGGMKLRIVSNRAAAATQIVYAAEPPAVHHAPAAVAAAPAAAAPAAAPVDETAGLKKVTSPMVGTFYRAPSPGAKNFAEIGDKVTEDSVLCIIEAMKLMNEIKAEVRGTVRKVLVENGQPVEYGQALFLVDPN
ncbi:acetyl-CoA carboxylase biotin carboxyl carrier protein [bacterium]|nr:acetyl-CoA carboxylase biotin carboxyl carrier protein [bacterium]